MEFERMSQEYRDKKYPQGSVFVKSTGKNRTNSLVLIVMLVIVAAALAAGLFYFFDLIAYHTAAGNSDQVTVGYVFVAVFAALLALCALGLVFSVKNLRRGVGAIIAASARASGLSEGEVRAFDQQAFRPDSYILKLKNAVSAAMANQTDGILTRDYLWLGDAANQIMRRSDMAGACLYQWSYYVQRKKVWCLSVSVANRQGLVISAETAQERGQALLALLKAAHPDLQVAPGVLREGTEYDQWRQSFAGGAGVR